MDSHLKQRLSPQLGRIVQEKNRERPLKKEKLRLNIARITKETDTICRSVKNSRRNPWKNVRSGSKTPAYAFAVSALTTLRISVTPLYSALSAETSVTAPYCIRRSGHPLNRRMKQSTKNVPCSVDLQEACPAARLCWWMSTADVTHTSLSASMLSLMSRATVPSSPAN